VDTDTGEVIADSGALIDETLARKLAGVGKGEFRVQPYVTDDVVYLSADEEEHYVIAQANTPINELGEFIGERVSGRVYDKFLIETVDRVSYMDVFSQAGMWVSRRRSFLSWSMMTPTAPP
jgi:DNA-directed RNA polymerase subunit beta